MALTQSSSTNQGLAEEFPTKPQLQTRILSDHFSCADKYYLVWRSENERSVWYLVSLTKKVLCKLASVSKRSDTNWRIQDKASSPSYRLLLVLCNGVVYATYKELDEEGNEKLLERLHICPPRHLLKALSRFVIGSSNPTPFPESEMNSPSSSPPSSPIPSNSSAPKYAKKRSPASAHESGYL